VFFHVRNLVGLPFDEQLIGRRVEFGIEQSDKGPRAINVMAEE
jgi:cold shock CspA family protein